MIQDIEGIKVGKNRLVSGKLLHRRGADAFIIDGDTFTLDGVLKYFNIQPPKNDKVVAVGPSINVEASKSAVDNSSVNDQIGKQPLTAGGTKVVVHDKLVAILVEPPARILSYHLYEKDLELAALKLAAISRKILLYYTVAEAKEGKYYAKQPWLIDWDTVSGNSKDFIKFASERFRDVSIKCPFCESEFSKLSSYVSHISSSHSYTKDRKPKVDRRPDEEEQNDQPDRKMAVAKKSEDFKCPHCDKVLKSASGRTNHIKTSHPDKS